MAEHGERRSAGVIFLGGELAAHLRQNAQHSEKPCSHPLLLHMQDMPGGGKIDAGSAVGIDRSIQKCGMIANHFPRPAILLHLIAFRALSFEVSNDARQTGWLWKRQRPEQDGVHHAEDSGVGADAER